MKQNVQNISLQFNRRLLLFHQLQQMWTLSYHQTFQFQTCYLFLGSRLHFFWLKQTLWNNVDLVLFSCQCDGCGKTGHVLSGL